MQDDRPLSVEFAPSEESISRASPGANLNFQVHVLPIIFAHEEIP